jgi:signal peptidase I
MNSIIQFFKDRLKALQKHSLLYEIVQFAALIIFVVIPIRVYVAQPFKVNGDSMYPTFHHKDYLVVDEISFRFRDPRRGEVIILKHPESNRYLIKRVIGLPGERLRVTRDSVIVYNSAHPDGVTLDESYLENKGNGPDREITIPEDFYFVMGDNRPYSSDSRAWGLLPADEVVGYAMLRLYPFNNISYLPGKKEVYSQAK